MSSSSTTSPDIENMHGPCKVCEKPGDGIHYGAWTCDSCKCFFARSLKRGIENLVCYKFPPSKCDVSNSQPHAICALCRFQKCVKVGMTNKSYRDRVDGQDTVSHSPSPAPSSQSSESMEINGDSLTESFDRHCLDGSSITSSATMYSEKENMYGPCKVCGNPGNGPHYGVWTCDACKSFFARSLRRKNERFFCGKNLNCDLSGSQPYAICKYCRFQKCVKVGMKSNAYRYRLDGQVERAFTSNNQFSSPSPSLQSSELIGVQPKPFDVSKFMELQEINNIVNSYKEGCCFTADKINGLVLKEFEMVINQNTDLARVKAWTDYAEECEADIRALLPFIDDLQDSFNSHDKAILLKRSAFQIYLLRRIRALNPYGLLLSDGRVIRMISLQFLYGIPLMNEMLHLVSRILQLGYTDEDVAMFVTMVYYKPGKLEDLANLNLQNPENLSPAQQKFKNLFMKHAKSRGVDQRVFQGLIELWPELERLKTMHQERLEYLKPYRWAFPENSLFAEVYDIDSKIVTIQNESNLPSYSPVINGSV